MNEETIIEILSGEGFKKTADYLDINQLCMSGSLTFGQWEDEVALKTREWQVKRFQTLIIQAKEEGKKEGRLEVINKVRQFNHINGVLRQEPSTRSLHDFEKKLVNEFLSPNKSDGGER